MALCSPALRVLLVLACCLGLLTQSAAIHLPNLPGGFDPSSFIPGIPSIEIPSWRSKLQEIWDSHKDRVSFCMGNELDDALDLLQRSFPLPLPVTTDVQDGVCANATTIYAHMCAPNEISIYLKYLLLTDNIEKIPSNMFCEVGDEADACAPGFFQQLSVDLNPLAPSVTKAHACCPGYFCPAMLTCMMPCPLGSHCPRAWAADPPAEYIKSDPDISKPLLGKQDKWCAPYGYKRRSKLGCGGADKWTIQPGGAFPSAWWAEGSGSIYCDGGHYCPTTTTRLTCKPGHFCKQGSSSMSPCPALASCPEGTETPTDNYLGFVLDGSMFLLLGLVWWVYRSINQLMRKLNSRERVRVMWHHMHPQVTVVQVAEEHKPNWDSTAPHESASNPIDSNNTPTAAAAATGGSSSSRFGFIRDLARRRSRAGGNAGAATTAPVWASFDGRDGQIAPLLEYELQEEAVAEGRRHSRSTSGIVFAANTTLTLEPMLLHPKQHGNGSSKPAAARALLRHSSEDGDLIPVGHYSSHDDSRGVLQPGVGGGVVGITGAYKPLMDVGFEGLSMRLKSCGKLVLQDVAGQLLHGQLTAIMGPSGAGKTTLMTALAGKASYGVVSGTITINGRRDRLERHKRLMGFVPQEDIMYRNLTVEENLAYSARFRLPAATSQTQRLEVVANAIAVLGLGDVRHALIGNEEVRGISGGQRKRVNVGLELVADPSLLFLDEPTSGLDSTASKLVVQGLKRVAGSGVTVTAVIHQPSYETFSMFDDLVLLAKGGLTAYCGPVKSVQTYFAGLGFEVPEHMNPADAYLDIVSGVILPKSGAAVDVAGCWRDQQGSSAGLQAGRSTSELLSSRHTSSSGSGGAGRAGGELAAAGRISSGGAAAAVVAIGGRRSSSSSVDGGAAGASSQPASGPRQQARALMGSVQRALLLWLALLGTAVHDTISSARDAAADTLHNWAVAIAARRTSRSSSSSGASRGTRAAAGGPGMDEASRNLLSSSSISSGKRDPPGFLRQYYWCLTRTVLMRTREPILVFTEYMIFAITGSFLGLMSERGRGNIFSYVGNVVYNIVAMGMLATVSGIKTFGGPDRIVYFREASSGLNKLAYFWALDAWGYVGILLRCGVYLIMYYTFSQPRAVVWQMYIVTCAIYYACTGMAYLLSQVMGPNAAQLTAAVAALINALVASKFSTTGVMGMMNRISYARWGLEGYVIAEANNLTGVWLLARCADLAVFSYDVTRFWYAMKVLAYIGFGSRIAACLGLLLLHRDKTL